jgi:hypothetical protein
MKYALLIYSSSRAREYASAASVNDDFVAYTRAVKDAGVLVAAVGHRGATSPELPGKLFEHAAASHSLAATSLARTIRKVSYLLMRRYPAALAASIPGSAGRPEATAAPHHLVRQWMRAMDGAIPARSEPGQPPRFPAGLARGEVPPGFGNAADPAG